MPTTKVSMHMKPFVFFAGNPMLDMPVENKSCHSDHGSCCGAEGGNCHCRPVVPAEE
jgi:primary-amine oxidase